MNASLNPNDDTRVGRSDELRQLRLVYSKSEFPVVEYRDRPDFVIDHGDIRFGVEVTAYFQNKASAHYHNHKDHMDHVASGGAIPKNEVGDIEAAFLVFETPNGPIRSNNMTWRRTPSAQERMDKLASIIDRKREQALKYDHAHGLSYYDLVIVDEHGELAAGSEGNLILERLKKLSSKPCPVAPFRRVTLVIRKNSWDTFHFSFCYEPEV